MPTTRLAAILPAPLKRRPERMDNYSAIILKRMRKWVGNQVAEACVFQERKFFLQNKHLFGFATAHADSSGHRSRYYDETEYGVFAFCTVVILPAARNGPSMKPAIILVIRGT